MLIFVASVLWLLVVKCHECQASENVDEAFKENLFNMIQSSSHIAPDETSIFASRKLGSTGPSSEPQMNNYAPPGHTSQRLVTRSKALHNKPRHHRDSSDFFDDDEAEPTGLSRRPRELKKPTVVEEDVASNGNAGNELHEASGSGGAAETSGGVALLALDDDTGGGGDAEFFNPSSSSASESGKKSNKMPIKKHGHKHKHQHEHYHKHYHKHAKWPKKTKSKKGSSKKPKKKKKKGSKSKKGGGKKGGKPGPEKEPGFGSSSSSANVDLPLIYVMAPTNDATSLGDDGSNTTPSRTGK